MPAAPESSFFAFGSGGNMIWVEPEHDLVIVTRWIRLSELGLRSAQWQRSGWAIERQSV
jgi:hypothetical protein